MTMSVKHVTHNQLRTLYVVDNLALFRFSSAN